jgi:hypothetical protein
VRRTHTRHVWLRQFENVVTLSQVFTPVLAKHSKSFSLIDCISVGVDRMQRNFEPMRKQVEAWQRSELTDVKSGCHEPSSSSLILTSSFEECVFWEVPS